jgi:hypothetical protein
VVVHGIDYICIHILTCIFACACMNYLYVFITATDNTSAFCVLVSVFWCVGFTYSAVDQTHSLIHPRQALHHSLTSPALRSLRWGLTLCLELALIHCVTQAGLELTILLSLPPKCWDYGMSHHSLC